MDEHTESKPASKVPGTSTPESGVRRPYSKPALIDYGDVASLTHGVGSAQGDRQSPKKQIVP